MLRTTLVLGAFCLSSAIGLMTPRHTYPPYLVSTGFRLIANVTDPESDTLGLAMRDTIGNWGLQGIHTGAGVNEAVLSNASSRIFYHNGSETDLRTGKGSILTDSGIPILPWGIYVQPEDKTDKVYKGDHDVAINIGMGTMGISFDQSPDPVSYVTGHVPGTFIACQRYVAYYKNDFIVVRYAYGQWNATTATYVPDVPEGCTPITFIPQCDRLFDLPEGSLSSHEYAQLTRCYNNVSLIDWSW
ncbi:hypothetical protein GGR50DRAFT_642104 [Xylaria sp. CBS 124048]|nr:hypothetical protein GGR50DRAFT_642104 [Xylaria sp. CBS 124048]